MIDLPQADRRRSDLDWMRLVLVLVAFLYTCARLFDGRPWHVKNLVTSPVFNEIVDILGLWMMPLFFLVSGGSIFSALDRQSPSSFVIAKVLRLFVPLVFGALVLAPPQVYLERLTTGTFSGTFFQFLPRYFEGLYGVQESGNFAFYGLHLWYLLALFLHSLLLLPLFMALKSLACRRFISRFATFASAPGVLQLLGVLPAVACVFLRPGGVPGTRAFGGWNLGFYLVMIILGYLFFSQPELQRLITWRRHWSLLLGVLLAVGARVVPTALVIPEKVLIALRALAAWSLILALLGYGLRHFAGAGPLPSRLIEGVLPFYMLSQPVILAAGYGLAAWSTGLALKYAVLAAVSLAIITALCEGIRRLSLLRFLFGLKPINTSRRAGPPGCQPSSPLEGDGIRAAAFSGGKK